MVPGPSSSHLLTANSIFVQQIQVIDSAKKGAVLHGFVKKPELSLETNWNVSKDLVVGSYRQQGFSLWLNKGSRIQIRWEVPIGNSSDLIVLLTKGEQTLKRSLSSSSNSLSLSHPTNGNGQAECIIEEDNSYYIHLVNMNPRSIVMMLNVNVSSKMYDVTNAVSKCSAINGLCHLKLHFPRMKYVVLTTPNNGDISGWSVELSFVARLATYVAILGLAAIFICLILKYLGACDGEASVDSTVEEVPVTETNPLLQEKRIQIDYGTSDEDPDSTMCSTSEDLYDGKICVICYDEQRNCFFVPCGHCATCYECAQRIIEGENKVCPICRRFIHKVRRLFIA
ncbi:E3 ubiquitin-protein ligase APD2-like isoform X2 [Macadamia integrifolia]|nr:E3 ubiquitin-protein ligase APD2-like isoform X2 [Macadamia integrifolia]XP_042493476.1 E3 ubiquitin-protein ligase APD2-like isoform X2 [Macadamia integrifolia]